MSVIAYHLIWTAYGTWLPNDPRGSGSRAVNTPELAELGAVHYGRKKSQPRRSEVREFYAKAEEQLGFPLVRFDSQQREAIGAVFGEVILRTQIYMLRLRRHAGSCAHCGTQASGLRRANDWQFARCDSNSVAK